MKATPRTLYLNVTQWHLIVSRAKSVLVIVYTGLLCVHTTQVIQERGKENCCTLYAGIV